MEDITNSASPSRSSTKASRGISAPANGSLSLADLIRAEVEAARRAVASPLVSLLDISSEAIPSFAALGISNENIHGVGEAEADASFDTVSNGEALTQNLPTEVIPSLGSVNVQDDQPVCDGKDGVETVGAVCTQDFRTAEDPKQATLNFSNEKPPRDVKPTVLTTHPIIHEYLLDNVEEYREVNRLRQIGWQSEEGDRHFEKQRHRSDHADTKSQKRFFDMMVELALELDEATCAFSSLKLVMFPKILDICMAPGGFSAAAMKRFPRARVCGISLPANKGGHRIGIPDWKNNSKINTTWLDLTMLAAEMGFKQIPPEHPEASEFVLLRPFEGIEFDLVFSDGQVLRTQHRLSYRLSSELVRLVTSQLVLALQRIKKGGTLVCRFHKIEAVDTATYLQIFSTFSEIELFKPVRKHAIRSSFYMVAKNVQPQSPEALRAVVGWKRQWAEATFDVNNEKANTSCTGDGLAIDEVEDLLKSFGPQLARLGGPIWEIQADALRITGFVQVKLVEKNKFDGSEGLGENEQPVED
ncbi:hypothetical protein BJ170DRAFT_693591 [Xylariales sp. AK1849]|nr:hypothetical protein BJ170DRAFT_693591 [Xylariales sp. AK1849]